MSTVPIAPPVQGETPSKAEPPQTLAHSPRSSQPASDNNDINLCHHHNRDKSEHYTEYSKFMEPIVTLTTENKPCVFAESISEKEKKAATVIQSVYRGYQ
ncbi:hypothetical protein BG015_007008 [Linnemannia schmuckeri]|uniref:Uncharacterized protein n=1 Tax=Linnemannia schmuckeri TaxID=64567 RepID=A0A9P5S2P0_9FUNG|nr:hypothetical protein BG015_007008 [Linnemannia schmuckeri]